VRELFRAIEDSSIVFDSKLKEPELTARDVKLMSAGSPSKLAKSHRRIGTNRAERSHRSDLDGSAGSVVSDESKRHHVNKFHPALKYLAL